MGEYSYSIGELIALFIVGYNIGNYIEEPKKIYVVTTYLISILLIPDFINLVVNYFLYDYIRTLVHPLISLSQVLAIIIGKILIIYLSTYYGAKRRKDGTRLPIIKLWKRIIYAIFVPGQAIFGYFTLLIFRKALYYSDLSYIKYLAFFNSIVFVLILGFMFSYLVYGMIMGDSYRSGSIVEEEDL